MRALPVLVTVMVLVLLVPVPAVAADSKRVPLTISTSGGASHAFAVEVVDDAGERGRGLMFRRQLAADRGMLFIFPRSERVAMWMRDTPLPLDMLFIASDGRIVDLHERAIPFSEETIVSRKPVRYVLEVPGGTVDRLGLAVGDRVSSPVMR